MASAFSARDVGSRDEDRLLVLHDRGDLLLVLADGAGGRAGGAAAATRLTAAARSRRGELFSQRLTPSQFLLESDASLRADPDAGESTAIVALLLGDEVSGASVGDSAAWSLDEEAWTDLTRSQVRKPLLGSGRAWPVPFGPRPRGSRRLLLASDGLFKYAPPSGIQALAATSPLADAPRALIELVRLPSGALQDDVAVIVAAAGHNRRL